MKTDKKLPAFSKRQLKKCLAGCIISVIILIFVIFCIPLILSGLNDNIKYALKSAFSPFPSPPRRFSESLSEGIPMFSPPIENQDDSDTSRDSAGDFDGCDGEVSLPEGMLFVKAANLCRYEIWEEPIWDLHNTTSYKENPQALSVAPLPDFGRKQDGPRVLVIHTHGTEAYLKDGCEYYEANEGFRSEDCSRNVVAVGDEFCKVLEERGIKVLHDRSLYDKDSFNDSYNKSRRGVEKALKENPSIQFIFDIHRDCIINSKGENIKPLCRINGLPCAQIMAVVGTDEGGADHKNWRENLIFGAYLQKIMSEDFPTLARPLCLRKASFNQQLSPGMILLEIGSCGNMISEAVRGANAAALSFCTFYDTYIDIE